MEMEKMKKTKILSVPEGKSIKITDKNFLLLLTENKGLRDKNSDLNKLVVSLTHQLNNCKAGVKSV